MAFETQLAIESIGKSGSLAVLQGESVLWQCQLPPEQRTAAQMAVHLKIALQERKNADRSPQWISVASGPGSFTGIRIAMTTAKCLGYALSVPIVPIGSLAALATNAMTAEPSTNASDGWPSQCLVGLNAFRQQVFTASFHRDELFRADQESFDSSLIHRSEVISRQHWDERLSTFIAESQNVVTGDPAIFGSGDAILPKPSANCDAVGVGRLASRLVKALGPDQAFQDPMSLAANYLKQSAAEEKAEQH